MTLQGWASLMRFTRILPFFALFAIVGAAFYPGLSGLAQEEEGTRPRQASVRSGILWGLPPIATPLDNPQTPEKVALGRKLYYDPILSIDNTVACATCHDPARGFTDGKQFAQGVRKQLATRNAPTVLNAAFFGDFFWDGRSHSLEKQAEDPVQNPKEMGNTLRGVEKKLNRNATYRREFEHVFGPGAITFANVAKALASFERTLVSGGSPFDRFHYGGDKGALTPAAQRGLEIFRSKNKGNCSACHGIDNRYPQFPFPEDSGGVGKKKRFVTAAAIPEEERFALFTDRKFHNTGVGADAQGHYQDLGRYLLTHADADKGAFKTPSLRNVALTAPYMHDGSLKTLKDVIDFYVRGGNPNPNQDPLIHPLQLTEQERADLLEFLQSLTGEIPPDSGPPQQTQSRVRAVR